MAAEAASEAPRMPTMRVLSLYCTEAGLAVWKAFAASRGLGTGPALKQPEFRRVDVPAI